MKKRNKLEIRSAQGIALILVVIIVGYFGYNFITKILAYSALVPKDYDISQQLPTNETVLYQNINKEKYGNYDYIAGRRGELIVRLKDRVPLYRIAQIAEQYGLQVEAKYSADVPSWILRIIDPGDDIGKMRIIDPGDDIGKYTANYLRQQGYKIDPNVRYDTLVSNGYLENIWRALEAHPDIYSVNLNTV
ncbi:MAG: hypothetical protein WC805_01220 [Patescibacteria group bacterium]|jgi:hypothetical protein